MIKLQIRAKLFLLVSFYTILALLFIYVVRTNSEKQQEWINYKYQFSEVENLMHSSFKVQNDFIIYESINEKYYKSNSSVYLKRFDSLNTKVDQMLTNIGNSFHQKNKEFYDELIVIKTKYRYNVKLFEKLSNVLFLRGYKSYGIEGEMRSAAHKLESEFENTPSLSDLLMLRRNEKDFIIRRENKYVNNFNLVYNDLIKKNITNTQKELLESYLDAFSRLVASEIAIGLKESYGLKRELDDSSNDIIKKASVVKSNLNKEAERVIEWYNIIYYSLIVVFIIVSFFTAKYFTKKLTRRINGLSKSLASFVDSGLKEKMELPKSKTSDEVEELVKNVGVLEHEILVKFKKYKDRVERRTNQILEQNEIIESKSNDLLASINYAKRIQETILPDSKFMKHVLNDFFLIYQPRDIVSGDFFWTYQIDEFKKVVVVGDCTGHGVPGAFMSLLGVNFLRQAIREQKMDQADMILNYLNVSLNYVLNDHRSEDSDVKDGMDISLVIINSEQNKICFSGAQQSIYHQSKDGLNVYKGSPFPIGGHYLKKELHYSTQTFDYEIGDMLYLTSDGLIDQFGGESAEQRSFGGKKFKQKRLKSRIDEIQNLSTDRQKEKLLSSFYGWKGDLNQIDDVCVMGVRL